MRLAHGRSFADPSVTAIVIDPLASNTRAIAWSSVMHAHIAPTSFERVLDTLEFLFKWVRHGRLLPVNAVVIRAAPPRNGAASHRH